MSDITYGKPIPVDPDGVHKDTVARLLLADGVDADDNLINPQPITDPVDVPAGKVVAFQAGVRNQPPKPPTSEWPEFAWNPDNYNNTVEVNDNLADALRAMGEGNNLIVLHERCIPQLAAIFADDPMLLWNHNFTARPDEFRQHALTFRCIKPMKFPGLQGFHITNPGGLGLAFTSTGSLNLRCNLISKCGQGIVVTSAGSNMSIRSQFNRYDEFLDFTRPQAVYITRGPFYSEEDVFSQVGHLRGDSRPSGSHLNHAIYAHLDAAVTVRNSFFADTDSHGINARGNTSINGIVCVRNATGIGIGHKEPNPSIEGIVHRAIIANMEDLDDTKLGVGIASEQSTITISNSIIADERSAGEGSAIRLYDRGHVRFNGGVRVQGMSRAIDVSGAYCSANGTLITDGATTNLVNKRPSSSNFSGSVKRTVSEPIALPDFDFMPYPEPGTVGALIDSVL